jgi:hypothetical protein
MQRLSFALILVITTSLASAQTQTAGRPEVWRAGVKFNRLADIGRGKAIIFSPDIAPPGNRQFYERLGFLYVAEASWQRATGRIIARNYWHPDDRVETIFLETHGTNGDGLKLQSGPARAAPRSYISIAALQERLDGLGVKLCVIAACNSGRLFRPGIYRTIRPQPRDRLFLPATLGIINASPAFDPRLSSILVVRRKESQIETINEGSISELSSVARGLLGWDKPRPRESRFVVSNLLIQMLLGDPRLKLASDGYSYEVSTRDLSATESESLFLRFVAFINAVAARERQRR